MQTQTGDMIVANLSWLSEVELISIHLPKTAGTTFGRIVLPQIYPHEQILYDNHSLPIETLIKQGKLTTKIRAIHGHFPAKKYQEYGPTAKMVIWLRNPILLLISAYYFLKSNNQVFFDENHRYVVENQLSFSDFIKQPFIDNSASKYFADEIKLTDFYFVGIQEFFIDDLNDLKKMLGWPTLKVSVANQNFHEDYQTKVMDILNNQSLVKKIVAIQSADMKLYQKALSLRYQRKGLSNYLEMYQLSLQESQARLGFNSFQAPKLTQRIGLGSERGVNPP
ncbi:MULTISPECIES: hypothetical protein [unclassified Microcoleus]|uniref:hypothetical protein n=1 Tax=unclassified Microcoleus TaxID=2642155 RepID=UPI002FD5E631